MDLMSQQPQYTLEFHRLTPHQLKKKFEQRKANSVKFKVKRHRFNIGYAEPAIDPVATKKPLKKMLESTEEDYEETRIISITNGEDSAR